MTDGLVGPTAEPVSDTDSPRDMERPWCRRSWRAAPPAPSCAYRQDLEAFRQFLRVLTLDAAAQALLTAAPGEAHALALAYQAHLLERGRQATTVNRRLATLRSLVQFAGHRSAA